MPPIEPVRRFAFRFDPAFRLPLALLGVRPETARVELGRDELTVRFGPWRLRTARDNVSGVELGGPYRWWRAVGPHLSLADGGVTFGTGVAAGVCIRLAMPVPALVPGPWPRHPAVTVTVTDPEALRDALVAPP
ncbi:hypothetical protein ACFFMM_25635 [Micromonospora chaiyaphumensis]|uniref:Uncharacterized protein n=1 Tax=Micromonospora chaiyaphumensis TaxID=307119 RepID=A0A1C4UH39_9ACTN|nr:hypothetical protein [Micromonospora chaiyaphumensis]SCE70988.1 hypothetical protein GA0070214_101678 [Micromonospora chaiyaphumensis]